ncbi:hypothetical protein EI94DRAFT_1701512 [Lactarius quietus]|nr:hypothetical protein EI94DRAFT_1701512 [Lactarius quietus]
MQLYCACSAKESNTPTGPPEAPMHSEEGSAFDFMQHIPFPITDAPSTTGQIEAAMVQSGGPLSAITVSSSSVASVPMSGLPSVPMPGLPSDVPPTSGGQKRPAPYDFMDQIPASQYIARNLPLQHGIPTSMIEADSAGPSIHFTLPEGSPTEDVPLSDDRILPDPTSLAQRRTPTFNAALDAKAEVLHCLLIDMHQMKKVLHNLNESLMRDHLILETLLMNIQKRPDDLEQPDI